MMLMFHSEHRLDNIIGFAFLSEMGKLENLYFSDLLS